MLPQKCVRILNPGTKIRRDTFFSRFLEKVGIQNHIYCIYIYVFTYSWNPNDLYFWRSTPPNKVFSHQNKGHLGSRYICIYIYGYIRSLFSTSKSSKTRDVSEPKTGSPGNLGSLLRQSLYPLGAETNRPCCAPGSCCLALFHQILPCFFRVFLLEDSRKVQEVVL